MKKFYFLLLALCLFTGVNAQIINIPDANFKAKLLAASPSNSIARDVNGVNITIDTNNNGEIEVSEVLNVFYLKVDYSNISDLTGIEHFNNLTNLNCQYNNLNTLNVNNVTTLQVLMCSNNHISSLNVNDLLVLKFLYCDFNQISSLNVSNSTNLEILTCVGNQLSLLDLNNLTYLMHVVCSDNQLTSLNTSGLVGLLHMSCSNNQLTSLDLSSAINLSSLNCSNNQLSSLNVNGLTSLWQLICSNNQLSTLDLSDSISFNNLNCDNNPLLISILLKNGSADTVSFLNNPSLQYICSDEAQISQIQDQITQYGYTNCTVNSYCSFNPGGAFYSIQGNHKWDSDNNGCDASDIIIPNLNFTITDGTLTTNIISNATGGYSIPIQAGLYTITPVIENPGYFTISPSNAIVEFPTQASPFVQDFCFTANGVHPDLEVIILPLIPARPGFDAKYKIIYKNKGNSIQSGSVNLTFNDAVLDFISANPVTSSQAINTLSWDFINLQPFETRELTCTLNVNSPMETPPVNIGYQLNFTAVINPVTGDEVPYDNTSDLKQIVVGSYDPNDKTCLEGTTLSPSMIGEYVHYMIRFENTGTFPAQNIVVKDIIDTTKFDISTLVPIQGSHSFVTRITEGNKVEFIFENINLPFDNATNDGFVAFKIKTLPSLVLGDTFENTANIYFDYNFPIVTNTATTTIQTLGTSDFEFSNYFTLYPNPAKEVLNIAVKNGVEVSSINIYNTLGQLVIAIPNAQTVSTIDVSRLTAGNYFIKMTTDKGTSNAKFIKN